MGKNHKTFEVKGKKIYKSETIITYLQSGISCEIA